jgi:hypothetical protein
MYKSESVCLCVHVEGRPVCRSGGAHTCVCDNCSTVTELFTTGEDLFDFYMLKSHKQMDSKYLIIT